MRCAVFTCFMCINSSLHHAMRVRTLPLLAVLALVLADCNPARAHTPAAAAADNNASWLSDHPLAVKNMELPLRCADLAWHHRAITFGVLGALPFIMMAGFSWHDRKKRSEARRPLTTENFKHTPAKDKRVIAA